MNKVIMIGRIASEIELRNTQSGVATCSFRLAVNRRFKNAAGERVADFFTVVCWRHTAEFVMRNFEKGDAIAIEGSLQQRTYDAQDGSKRYFTEIVADNVEFAGAKHDRPDESVQGEFTEVDDDELPF